MLLFLHRIMQVKNSHQDAAVSASIGHRHPEHTMENDNSTIGFRKSAMHVKKDYQIDYKKLYVAKRATLLAINLLMNGNICLAWQA